ALPSAGRAFRVRRPADRGGPEPATPAGRTWPPLRRVRVKRGGDLYELGAVPLDPGDAATTIAQVRQEGRIRLRRTKWAAAGNHIAVTRRHNTPKLSRSAVTPKPPGRVGHCVSPP